MLSGTFGVRVLLLLLWLNDGPDSSFGSGRRSGCSIAPYHLEKLINCIVGNIISVNLILAPPQPRLLEKLHFVGFAVIFHAFAPALDILILTVALLPEAGEITKSSCVLEPVGIFLDRHLIRADDQCSLSEHDVTGKRGKLVGILHGCAVGLQMDWLIAVRFFGQSGPREKHTDEEDGESLFHEYLIEKEKAAGAEVNASLYEELLPETITG